MESSESDRAPEEKTPLSLLDLLVAIGILVVLATIAHGFLGGRPHRPPHLHEPTDTLPALAAWQDRHRERHGSYVFSDDPGDAIAFDVVSRDRCEGRRRSGTFGKATYDTVTPSGCLWEYVAMADRCDDLCTWEGTDDACRDESCYCLIARVSSRAPARSLPRDARFCIDDRKERRTTLAGEAPRSW